MPRNPCELPESGFLTPALARRSTPKWPGGSSSSFLNAPTQMPKWGNPALQMKSGLGGSPSSSAAYYRNLKKSLKVSGTAVFSCMRGATGQFKECDWGSMFRQLARETSGREWRGCVLVDHCVGSGARLLRLESSLCWVTLDE